jgi:hypothetical protein
VLNGCLELVGHGSLHIYGRLRLSDGVRSPDRSSGYQLAGLYGSGRHEDGGYNKAWQVGWGARCECLCTFLLSVSLPYTDLCLDVLGLFEGVLAIGILGLYK